MPFKSKAQQRFMFAAESRGELRKGTALRWAHHTDNIKALPEKVGVYALLDASLPTLGASGCVTAAPSAGEPGAKEASQGGAAVPRSILSSLLADVPGGAPPDDVGRNAQKRAVSKAIPISLGSLGEEEGKTAAFTNDDLDVGSPYMARALRGFEMSKYSRAGHLHPLLVPTTKEAAPSSLPTTALQERMVLPHVGHLKTPTAAALHALQQRRAEEAAEQAKKTDDKPPAGLPLTDGAQNAMAFSAGATGDQPGSGTSVGPGNSPSSHPITSYSGLGPPGTVNGNAAFGTRNNSLTGAAKSGADYGDRLRQLYERRDPAGIEADNPFRQEFLQQPGIENLLDSLGMGIDGQGKPFAKRFPGRQQLKESSAAEVSLGDWFQEWLEKLGGVLDDALAVRQQANDPLAALHKDNLAQTAQNLDSRARFKLRPAAAKHYPLQMPGAGSFVPGAVPQQPAPKPAAPIQGAAVPAHDANLATFGALPSMKLGGVLQDVVQHPATPFVVQPVIGAGVSLGMNEIMRRLIESYQGKPIDDRSVRRERLMAAGMGAGMGLYRAAQPHATKSIMQMLESGTSANV